MKQIALFIFLLLLTFISPFTNTVQALPICGSFGAAICGDPTSLCASICGAGAHIDHCGTLGPGSVIVFCTF
jgi:hypothetical protein